MTYRVGVLGAGYFAQFHIDAWRRLAGATLAGVADADPAKGADYPDLTRLIEGARPDIIDIATPPPTHAAAIREAFAARPKAIICQKQFCTSLEEARTITAEADAAGIPLIVHENFRFQPWFRAMKTALDQGRIARPLTLTFRLRPGDGQGPEAYMARQPYFQTMPRFMVHETGVHYLDTFGYLFGRPDGLYADLRRLNPASAGEDAGHVLLDWADGRRALLDGNRLVDFDTDNPRRTFGEALLEGEAGVITLRSDGALTLRAQGSRELETLLEPRDWPGFAGDSVAAFQAHVIEGIETGEFETAATDYLAVMELVEFAYRSDAEGRRLEIFPTGRGTDPR